MANILLTQLEEIKEKIPFHTKKNESVSKATVAWQLHHVLMATISVCKALEKSNPENYKWKFNLLRLYIFTIGSIPRGRGKAPKGVNPPDNISQEDIEEALSKTQEALNKFESLPPNAHFPHPYFGTLNKKQTRKFIIIHTEHHLKIVRDILKA